MSRPFCVLKHLGPEASVLSGTHVLLGQPLLHSGLEHVHGAHHILPADGTLAHALAALGAGDHVATLEQDTVDDGIHADTAQAVILLVLQLQPLTI